MAAPPYRYQQQIVDESGNVLGTATHPLITGQDATQDTISLIPTTSGGTTPYVNLDLGVTGQIVKNAAGQLYSYYIYNNANAARYVKFYDKASAPTGGDTPVWVLGIPAGAAANVPLPNGLAFAAGISIRGTTGVANADTGAPTANDIVISLGYK